MLEKVIVGSLSSAITALIAFLLSMRRNRAEVKKTEIEALKGALEIWQNTVDELRSEVNKLREDNSKLRSEITRLRTLNNKIIRLIENLTPHNLEDVKNEVRNIKHE